MIKKKEPLGASFVTIDKRRGGGLVKGDIFSPIYVFCSFSVKEESTPIKSIVGIYWQNQKLTHNKSKIGELILAV